MTKTLKELFEEIITEQILKQQTIPTIISIKKWHREFQANKPHVKLVKDLFENNTWLHWKSYGQDQPKD